VNNRQARGRVRSRAPSRWQGAALAILTAGCTGTATHCLASPHDSAG